MLYLFLKKVYSFKNPVILCNLHLICPGIGLIFLNVQISFFLDVGLMWMIWFKLDSNILTYYSKTFYNLRWPQMDKSQRLIAKHKSKWYNGKTEVLKYWNWNSETKIKTITMSQSIQGTKTQMSKPQWKMWQEIQKC